MIEAYEFFSSVPGPTVVIFGAVHGNERCGPEAIRMLIDELREGKRRLMRGTVIFIPVANPKAYKKNLRQTEENLNRVFRKTRTPKSYEAKLANELTSVIDRADFFLDVHSFSAEGRPFIFLDYPNTPKGNKNFIRALGFKNGVSGWDKLYASEPSGYDTTRYAAENGVYNAIVECGQHSDPRAVDVAYKTMLRMLRYIKILSGGMGKRENLREVVMKKVFFKENKNDFFPKKWKHFDAVKKSQVMGYRADKTPIKAPTDGFVVLPKSWADKGEEWFYFGTEKK